MLTTFKISVFLNSTYLQTIKQYNVHELDIWHVYLKNTVIKIVFISLKV